MRSTARSHARAVFINVREERMPRRREIPDWDLWAQKVSRMPTINEPSCRVIGDPDHQRWYYSSPSLRGTSTNTQDEWPPVGRCRTRSWKPSPSNGGATKVCHEPWWTKGVVTLSLNVMLRDVERGEGRGKILSAPRSDLNRLALKMHPDSVQLRCVI
jgi:hypothetical protein